jgi:hypothetical protein
MPTPTHIACIDAGELAITNAAPQHGRLGPFENIEYLPTDHVVFEAPLTDPAAESAADKILTDLGWTRTGDWQTTGHLAFTHAPLAATHGTYLVTLAAAPDTAGLAGVTLDDPRCVTIPGLAQHPDYQAWLRRFGGGDRAVWMIQAGADLPGIPTITLQMPLPGPVIDDVHYFVDMGRDQFAEYIAGHPALAATGRTATQTGTVVWLSRSALDVLADLPRDTDGHYDGQHIWIGKCGYPVTALTVDEVAALDRCPDCNSRARAIRPNTDAADGNPCTNPWHDEPENA